MTAVENGNGSELPPQPPSGGILLGAEPALNAVRQQMGILCGACERPVEKERDVPVEDGRPSVRFNEALEWVALTASIIEGTPNVNVSRVITCGRPDCPDDQLRAEAEAVRVVPAWHIREKKDADAAE